MNLELRLRGEEGKLNEFLRPRITVDIDHDPYNKDCNICITMDAQYGQPARYIELTHTEARQLAAHLLEVADLSLTKAA